jgi:hypothetical protein
MTARLTNYDAHGDRWSADRTVRVTPQYDKDVLARMPWTNPRLRPFRYEIVDVFDQGNVRYAKTLTEARAEVARILTEDRHPLAWQDWEQWGGGWRRYSLDGMVELRVGRSEDANHSGLWGVGILGCGPVRSWLSHIRHPEARRAFLTAAAENLHHRERQEATR